VGASGDLAPLAHLALVLVGEGEAWVGGRRMPGAAALAAAGLRPLRLEAKEGLALVNGTQIMTAIGLLATADAAHVMGAAEVAAAMSTEALLGSHVPFDLRLAAARPHPGHLRVARRLRKLLRPSAINRSHEDCGRVQDAYSLRCVPQVLGASWDALEHVGRVLAIEMNSVTDNPLCFPAGRGGAILSGGNFHGQPVALALDYLAMAVAEAGSISERRTFKLLDASRSDLPPFLSRHPGTHSGLMVTQYTAAALVSENKILCHPASVDSIPTCADTEDHVSMGPIAARKAAAVVVNVARVVAIELIVAAEALEYRRPLTSGPGVEAAHALVRAEVPRLDGDRELAPAIAAVVAQVLAGKYAAIR
jgi:histidine ammonia-lyase